jgi:hypothetical protein
MVNCPFLLMVTIFMCIGSIIAKPEVYLRDLGFRSCIEGLSVHPYATTAPVCKSLPRRVLSEADAQHRAPLPPTIAKRPIRLPADPPHRIDSELTGRMPARTHSSHPSQRRHPPVVRGTLVQWFAAAGYAVSIGRRPHGRGLSSASSLSSRLDKGVPMPPSLLG